MRTLGGALRAHRASAPPSPPLGSGRYDLWLQSFYSERLAELDGACVGAGPEALRRFRDLDDDLWALLLTQEYEVFPNIKSLLPEMPEASLQVVWNGASGIALAAQSLAFYTKLRHLHERHSDGDLADGRVLDFGCGWGRLTRMLSRDVEPGSLFGCDPVQAILDVARRCRVPATLALSEFVPERLPFQESFDLAFSFSVFTHLSEPAHQAALRALHASIRPGGLLIATIRSPEYLRVTELLHPALTSLGSRPAQRLSAPLYLFAPHAGMPLSAEAPAPGITYGETVITLPYVRERWSEMFELLDVGLMVGDPHQVVLALRRS